MNLTQAILEATRCYVGITENDRSQYNPNTMRHLLTLVESAQSQPENWEPLRQWVNTHFNGSNLEYMESVLPKVKKPAKKSLRDDDPVPTDEDN